MVSSSLLPPRTRRVAAGALLALAVPFAFAACSDGDSGDSASTTRAPEQITVADSKVTTGLAGMKMLFSDAADAVRTKSGSPSIFPDQIENQWKQIEGTVKKNEPKVYLDVEDSMSAMNTAIEDAQADAAAAASAKFTAAVDAYLAKHP